jgi:hypothetical protein
MPLDIDMRDADKGGGDSMMLRNIREREVWS